MSQSAERNKELVRQFIEGLSGDIDAAFELVAEDAVFWLAGDLPGTGEHSKADRLRDAKRGAATFAEMPSFNINSMTAEDDRVVVEADIVATYMNDEEYRQWYVFVFYLRDALIVRENIYLDTERMTRIAAKALEEFENR